VLPVIRGPREYSYFTQTTRTNNAAPVAPGGTKPTSVYTLDRVEESLTVIAHLSEAIDKYWLQDGPSLAQFVRDELLYGLMFELEDQILNGDGTGINFTGLANTSGIQTQALVGTDLLATTRRALTDLETLGLSPAYFVFSAPDWEAIEMAAAAQFAANPNINPVTPMSRRLWGLPVVTTVSQAAETGYLIAADSVALRTDTQGVAIEWDTSIGFTVNTVRARCEGRFGLTVLRPPGVVKIALA
jgi:HK97 family phage major capsid protein